MEENLFSKKKTYFVMIAIFSVVIIVGILLLLPNIQNSIIKYVEKFMGRQLGDLNKWNSIVKKMGSFLLIFDFTLVILFLCDAKLNFCYENKIISSMQNKISFFYAMEKKHIFKTVFTASLIIFFVAHAYCFLNILYSHDSLQLFQDDDIWQISLGRFIQPFYIFVRGKIISPLMIGTLSFLFLTASIYMIVKILQLKSIIQIWLTAGILITSSTYILSNSTYLPWSDIYMLALLCAVAAAYAAIYYKRFYVLCIFFIVLSMGLYQSYVQVTVILLVFDVLLDILSNKALKNILYKSIKYLILIIIAFLIYICIFKLSLTACKIQASTYNGVNNVGRYDSIMQIVKLFIGTYLFVFSNFFIPITTHEKITIVINSLLFAFATFCVYSIARKYKISKQNVVLLFVGIFIFPFALNFIYFISKGIEHDLMTYSFSVVPIFLLALINIYDSKFKGIFTTIVYVCFAILIFNAIIFANQTYLNKDLTHRATLSFFTRVIDRIEQTDGYVHGETPVCFIGTPNANTIVAKHRNGFNVKGTGNSSISAVTYSIPMYLENILAYPVKFYNDMASDEIVYSLEVFPHKNSCKVIDGILYIRLSEDYK